MKRLNSKLRKEIIESFSEAEGLSQKWRLIILRLLNYHIFYFTKDTLNFEELSERGITGKFRTLGPEWDKINRCWITKVVGSILCYLTIYITESRGDEIHISVKSGVFEFSEKVFNLPYPKK